MSRQIWKPGNMLYPLPAVMVSTADKEGNSNIITIAWTGTVCTNPAMVYISVRPERYSYHMIKESGEFVINLTTEKLTKATDYCGVRSGENVDKWKECRLTQGKASSLEFAPIIEESPVNIECKVKKMEELGIIKGTKILLNLPKLGYDVCCFVGIYIDKTSSFSEVFDEMSKIKEVVELHLTTGDYSVFAKVICKNISDLQDILLNKINVISGIQRTDTIISLNQPIDRNISI